MTAREMTRTARGNFRAYEASKYFDIEQAYKSCSVAKYNAWRYCRDLCEKMNGYGLKVIHKNTFIFTAGFESVDSETGEVLFTYITPNYDVTIDNLGDL